MGMSNIEKVAKALYAHRQSVGDFPEGLTAWEELPEAWREEWREAAQALADAGLLAPDLPRAFGPDGKPVEEMP